MKKITLSIILTCFITVISFAQSSKELLASNARDKFEGKWIGVVNGDSVIIYLLQTAHKFEKMKPFAMIR
jgi:hypothetical protein